MKTKNIYLAKSPNTNIKAINSPKGSYPSSLSLNSYKVDSQIYKQKLLELKTENDTKQHQIIKIKQHQNALNQKLENLINENTILKSIINKRQPNHEQCNMKLKQKNIELQSKNLQITKYKKMYQSQLQNKRKVQDFYEKQVKQLKSDQRILIIKYEQIINNLNSQIIKLKANTIQSNLNLNSNSTYSTYKTPVSKKNQQKQILFQKASSHADKPKNNSNYAQINSSLIRSNQTKENLVSYQNNLQTSSVNRKIQQFNKKQILKKFIQELHQNIINLSMNIQEFFALPALKNLKNLKNHSQKIIQKKELSKILSQFPFNIKSSQYQAKIYLTLQKEILIQYGQFNGQNIVKFLQNQLQQYFVYEEEDVFNAKNYNPQSQLSQLQFSKQNTNSVNYPTYAEQSQSEINMY